MITQRFQRFDVLPYRRLIITEIHDFATLDRSEPAYSDVAHYGTNLILLVVKK